MNFVIKRWIWTRAWRSQPRPINLPSENWAQVNPLLIQLDLEWRGPNLAKILACSVWALWFWTWRVDFLSLPECILYWVEDLESLECFFSEKLSFEIMESGFVMFDFMGKWYTPKYLIFDWISISLRKVYKISVISLI